MNSWTEEKEELSDGEKEILTSQEIGPIKITAQPQRTERYLEYCLDMEGVRLRCQETKPQFSQNGIRYDPKTFKKFNYDLIDQFNNYEVVLLEVHIGGFTVPLKILNQDRSSPLSTQQPFSEGKFGKILEVSFQGQSLAVKCLPLSLNLNHSARKKAITKGLKELCLFKISESLGVGPVLPKLLGFDAVLYRNSFEIVMQMCDYLPKKLAEHQQSLFESLGLLHLHKVIHLDIKPDNVMFSKTRNKMVFIDFGLSKVIEEDIGFKTFTYFRGTPQFVSKEMLKLFSIKCRSGYVDLYYNDLIGLKTTLEQLSQTLTEEYKLVQQNFGFSVKKINLKLSEQSQLNFPRISDDFLFILFKHECFFRAERAVKLLKQNRSIFLKNYSKSLLTFLTEILPSSHAQGLVFNQLKDLSHLQEYENFEKRSKFFEESPIPKTLTVKQSIFKIQWQKQINFQNRIEQLDGKMHYQLIIEHLSDRKYFDFCEEKQEYYTKLFDCLRFDKKNVDVTVKAKLAASFLQIISSKEEKKDQQFENPLKPIQQAFQFLFSYCLKSSSLPWRNKFRFNLLVQIVLTDADVVGQLNILARQIEVESRFEELFTLFCEFFKIQVLYKMIILSNQESVQMLRKSEDIFDIIYHKIKQNQHSLESYPKIESALLIIVYQSWKDNIFSQHHQQNYESLQKVDDQSHKFSIKSMLWSVEIKTWVCNRNYFQFYGIREKISKQSIIKSIKFRDENFVESLYWSIALTGEHSESSFVGKSNRFKDYVIERINCKEISNRLIYFFLKIQQNYVDLDKIRQLHKKVLKKRVYQRRNSNFVPPIPPSMDQLFQSLINYEQGGFVRLHSDMGTNLLRLFWNFLNEFIRNMVQKENQQNTMSTSAKRFFYYEWKLFLRIYQTFNKYVYTEDYPHPCIALIGNIYWKILNKYALQTQLQEEQLHKFINYQTFLRDDVLSKDKSVVMTFKRQLQMLQGIHNNSLHLFFQDKIMKTKFEGGQIWNERLQQWKKNLRLWIHKYIVVNNLIFPFYISFQSMTQRSRMADALELLYLKGLDTDIYLFLVKMVEQLGKHPFNYYSNQFRYYISKFYYKHPKFLTYEKVKQYFGPVTRKNRFCLHIYYITVINQNYSVFHEKFLKLFVMIALNLHTQTIYMRQYILTQYYYLIFFVFKEKCFANHRQRKYFFMKEAFRIMLNVQNYNIRALEMALEYARVCFKDKRRRKRFPTVFSVKLEQKIERFRKLIPMEELQGRKTVKSIQRIY